MGAEIAFQAKGPLQFAPRSHHLMSQSESRVPVSTTMRVSALHAASSIAQHTGTFRPQAAARVQRVISRA